MIEQVAKNNEPPIGCSCRPHNPDAPVPCPRHHALMHCKAAAYDKMIARAQPVAVSREEVARNASWNARVDAAFVLTEEIKLRKRAVTALEKFVLYESWMDRYADDDEVTTYKRHTYGALREAKNIIEEQAGALPSSDGLREALKPFADAAESYDPIPGVCLTYGNVELWQQPQRAGYRLTVQNLRDARAALSIQSPTAQEGVQAASEPGTDFSDVMPLWQSLQLALLLGKLSDWRNEDHADNITLCRSDVIAIIDGVKALRSKTLVTAEHETFPNSGAPQPRGESAQTNATQPVGSPNLPAAWGRVVDDKAVTVSREWTPANDEPLYATPPVPDRAAWQPIETVPKDGTEILGWWSGGKTHALVCWSEDGWKDCADGAAISAPTHWKLLEDGPLPEKGRTDK